MNVSATRLALSALAVSALLAMSADLALAGPKSVVSANGPFSYNPSVAGSATFIGGAGDPQKGGFKVCAGQTGATIFPAGEESAEADIRVFGIEQIADADGNPLDPTIDVDLESLLGAQFLDAIDVSPNAATFHAGGTCVNVTVTVANPLVAGIDLGDYVIVVKAQAPGSGIGVGSGSRFNLSLRPDTSEDIVAPDLLINSPVTGNSYILGPIPVNITANDPVPGTGVQSIIAGIESDGGVGQSITGVSSDAPKPAGEDATYTGTFTPIGGSGLIGTTLASTFTAASSSGIGTYVLDAEAADGAGNIADASSTFTVSYNVQFLEASTKTTGQQKNWSANFTFQAVRSDGTPMCDKTVVAKLFTTDNAATPVAIHVWGTAGGASEVVQLHDDPTNADVEKHCVYITSFVNGDFQGDGPYVVDDYKMRVYFQDVDGNTEVQQGESGVVHF